MRSHDELQNIVAEILLELRTSAGISKSKMADRLNVDERTYRRYETGEAQPSLVTFIEMMEQLDAPVLPVILRHLYPESFEIFPGSRPSEIRHAVAEYALHTATDRDVRQLAYIMQGEHGSPLEAVLQLFCAYEHLPLDVRLMIAKLVINSWEISAARDCLICEDNVMPDMELLRSAVIKAHQAVTEGRTSYTSAIK